MLITTFSSNKTNRFHLPTPSVPILPKSVRERGEVKFLYCTPQERLEIIRQTERPEKTIGVGKNCLVYNLPIKGCVLKKPIGTEVTLADTGTIRVLRNDFPRLNVGQAIYQLGQSEGGRHKQIAIHRKVPGICLLPRRVTTEDLTRNPSQIPATEDRLLLNLSMLSSLDMSAYANFVQKILFIQTVKSSSDGSRHVFDSNAGNVTLQTNKIRPLDLTTVTEHKKYSPSFSFDRMLRALLSPEILSHVLSTRTTPLNCIGSVRQHLRDIVQKSAAAVRKTNTRLYSEDGPYPTCEESIATIADLMGLQVNRTRASEGLFRQFAV